MPEYTNSNTSLTKKLGIKPNFKIRLINEPKYYLLLLDDLPENLSFISEEKILCNMIHYFCMSAEDLNNNLPALRNEIEQNGMIWVSWPKLSSKVETDLNENIVRNMALKNGLVDVKVCSVDDIWSALKLVIRIKDRK